MDMPMTWDDALNGLSDRDIDELVHECRLYGDGYYTYDQFVQVLQLIFKEAIG